MSFALFRFVKALTRTFLLLIFLIIGSQAYAQNFVLNVASNQFMRIYGGADATSETLEKIRGGTVVKDMGASRNGWRYVSYTKPSGEIVYGFMYDGNRVEGGYLVETSQRTQSVSTQRQVRSTTPYHVSGTNSCLFLRPRATRSGDRGCFTNGTNVFKTGRTRNGFSEVVLSDGRTGWMGSRYLRRGRSSQTEASAPCIDCQTQAQRPSGGITVGRGAFSDYHRKPEVAGMIAACKRRYGNRSTRNLCLQGVRLSGQESVCF